MKSKLLLLVVVLAVGVYFLWQWGRADRAIATPETPGVARAAAPANSATTPLEPLPTPAPAPESAPAAAAGEHVAVDIPAEDFAVKYTGWSLERLTGAQATVDDSVMVMLEQIYAERLAAGRFEEKFTAPGESFTSPEFHGPSKVWSGPGEGGQTRHRWVEIHDGESPALDALRKEQGWLTTKISSLRTPKKA